VEEEEREEVGAMDLASDEDEPVEPADKVSQLLFYFSKFILDKKGL
jgi:hypothetical protein